MEYLKRIIDKDIEEKLSISGALVIKGPKWCGKTTSAKRLAKSILEMQNPDLAQNHLELASTKPSLLLEGAKPRLIDEWQLAPNLWNAVRYDVDKTGNYGDYILTGSATPIYDKNMHSGVGRFSMLIMKPMTLYESLESNGSISHKDILDKKVNVNGQKTDLTYEKIAYLICRGGWPNAIKLDEKKALGIAKNYFDILCETDMSVIDSIKRDPELVRLILKSYARQIATIDSDKSLYDDIKANYASITDKTIIDYLESLKRLYIIEELPAWNPNIRSKTSIRTSPKKLMIDPSLAVAALNINQKELMIDIRTYGLLFENLVARDLSVYVNAIGGSLNHYRDRFGLECDFVIRFNK
jgi:predicted AAA+ superfamily ATPase